MTKPEKAAKAVTQTLQDSPAPVQKPETLSHGPELFRAKSVQFKNPVDYKQSATDSQNDIVVDLKLGKVTITDRRTGARASTPLFNVVEWRE